MSIVIASHLVHIFCRLYCFPVVCELSRQASSKCHFSFPGTWFLIFVILKMQTQLSIHGDSHGSICRDQFLVKRSQIPICTICICCKCGTEIIPASAVHSPPTHIWLLPVVSFQQILTGNCLKHIERSLTDCKHWTSQ